MTKYIEFQGQRLAFLDNEAKAPVLVFLHGFCEDSSMWEDFTEPLEEDYRIILVDLPGFGKSATLEQASIEGYGHLVNQLLEELAIEEFILIGHSMGGYTALELARLAGDKLKGLGLFHSHPYADTEDKKMARDKARDFILTHGHELYVKQFIPNLFVPEFARSHTFLVDKMIHRASRFPQAGILGALEAMKNRRDNAEVLQQAKYPVLFIVGEMDAAVPFDLSVEQTHLASVADIHILPKVGHMGMFKAPKETLAIVKRFVLFCLEHVQ